LPGAEDLVDAEREVRKGERAQRAPAGDPNKIAVAVRRWHAAHLDHLAGEIHDPNLGDAGGGVAWKLDA